MNDSSEPQLLRAIGRWTLVGLVLNNVIGSGIFGLPSAMARYLGSAAPLAYVFGAVAIGIIMAVFAEVSSQYRQTGGQYLYARDAFGPFAGVQIGWFFLLVRVTSGAAVLNLFVNYLAEFWPAATVPGLRAAVMTGLVAGLTVVNYRGVRVGACVSNTLTIAKLGSLGLFVVAGNPVAPMQSRHGRVARSGWELAGCPWNRFLCLSRPTHDLNSCSHHKRRNGHWHGELAYGANSDAGARDTHELAAGMSRRDSSPWPRAKGSIKGAIADLSTSD